ncbi:MAG TPA: helix-turn-helix transcriptional regulator [Bacilli bacterium]|nr:MAG: anaerobic benzoate catabolism transcriptional regulator [Tenericutes bacterium ADurb.BinA124]HNZ50448.1 helix-turn-helix transcriptional regulator [Bacilli bacterium]HPN61099.1 helix-turn-helix transcriptional regulator [Bacilli bacterium]HPX84413.1 helix-turn-helix transcriptional regulator [Bacilli bacterium]HQC74470.1 helix-turn-helix transcriptional regulator [Bacilli bacterium]
MSLHELNRVFGTRIKEIRISKGLTQEKLAEHLQIHRTFVGQIERAEKNISLSTLGKIAEKLEINVAELLKEQQSK